MPNPRLHSAVVGALVIACATVACFAELEEALQASLAVG